MDKEIVKGLKTYKNMGLKELKKQLRGRENAEEIAEYYLKRHDEISENTDFGENNYKLHFMSHIIAVLSIYEAVLKFGYTKKDAYEMVEKCQGSLRKIGKAMYNFIDLLPGGYKIVRASIMKDFSGELGKNFKAEFPMDDERGFSYIVHDCVYVNTMREMGHPELVRACCDNDIICFSEMKHHVKWSRKYNVGEKEGIHCSDVFEKVGK